VEVPERGAEGHLGAPHRLISGTSTAFRMVQQRVGESWGDAADSDRPKTSVVITCYNYARFLPTSLESVLSQTYKNLEIIVVNDGSPDNTDEVVAPYLTEPRLTYVKQRNGGQASAKNTGLRLSRGEYVAFLDADDLWVETKLEKQLPLFVDPGVAVVYSRMKLLYRDLLVDYEPPNRYLEPHRGRITNDLFYDNFIPFSSAIVRKACLNRHGVFDETLKMSIDWELWLRLSLHYGFDYVDEPLLIYRQGHEGQMSRSGEVRQQCSDRVMNRFLEQNPDLLPRSLVRGAWAYSFVNRGRYFRDKDLARSTQYYLRSLKTKPIQITAFKGLAGNLLHCARRTLTRFSDGASQR